MTLETIPNVAEIFSGQTSYADAVRDVDAGTLRPLTEQCFALIDGILAGLTDDKVVFVPHDPAIAEGGEAGWTLGHVVVHLTASQEEAAAVAATLARGVPLEGRLRYEVPWETVHSAQQVQSRLAESRRMCAAFFDTWPAEPHLEVTRTPIPQLGPLNAVGAYMLGLMHTKGHLPQLEEIMRQARAAHG